MFRKLVLLCALAISTATQVANAVPLLTFTAKGTYHGGLEAGPWDGTFTPKPFTHTVWINTESCVSNGSSSWGRRWDCSTKGSFETVNSVYDTPWTKGNLWISNGYVSASYQHFFYTDPPPPGTPEREIEMWGWLGGGEVGAYLNGPYSAISDLTKQSIHYYNENPYQEMSQASLYYSRPAGGSILAETGLRTLDITVIPEPGTVSLLSLALTGLFVARRRKFKAAA